MEADPNKKLLQKAGSLLARRSHSRGELRDKLAAHGGAVEVETVLDRLERLNLLNDTDYAYNLAVRWIRQEGWGPIKVHHLLMRRHIAAPVADSAIDRVRLEISDEVALESYLKRLCRTHPLPGDRRGIHKLFLSLQRRGFPEEAIWSVLRKRIPLAAWQIFETGE
jgi:regulatory protein